MTQILLFIILSTPAVLSQFASLSLQPDISFGENNDRFDLTGLFGQERTERDDENEDEDEQNRRRSIRSEDGYIPTITEFRRFMSQRPANRYIRPIYGHFRRSGSGRWIPEQDTFAGLRRSEWLDHMVDDNHGVVDENEVYKRAQEYRRRVEPFIRRFEEKKRLQKRVNNTNGLIPGSRSGPLAAGEREIILEYPLKVKIRVKDNVNGSPTISGINLL